jgi:hypothetical protein
LDQSANFTGTVSGFDSNDHIDLGDVQYSANTTVSYTANADNSGGLLTVSDGQHTTAVSLSGQYAASSFQIAADVGTGTMVSYVLTGTQTEQHA